MRRKIQFGKLGGKGADRDRNCRVGIPQVLAVFLTKPVVKNLFETEESRP